MERKKLTVPSIIQMKNQGTKISALTAYDFLTGLLLDQAGIDIVLVGDSCAMVFQGQENTLPYTMKEALYHSQVVRKGVSSALLVSDMPFLSYQSSAEKAVINAGHFFKKAQVDAVKLEGGRSLQTRVRRIVQAGMPVMGHLGLTPQSIKTFGGYGLRAKTEQEAELLIEDALYLQDAGIFSLVLEKIPAGLAKQVTDKLDIPTIGIGAGPHCDGQILVTQDMLGLFPNFQPKFVRQYTDLANQMTIAFQKYIHDVKNSEFPSSNESYQGTL
jgi:3-methyl-2-oxobutanoate hydroxymethyltransferase